MSISSMLIYTSSSINYSTWFLLLSETCFSNLISLAIYILSSKWAFSFVSIWSFLYWSISFVWFSVIIASWNFITTNIDSLFISICICISSTYFCFTISAMCNLTTNCPFPCINIWNICSCNINSFSMCLCISNWTSTSFFVSIIYISACGCNLMSFNCITWSFISFSRFSTLNWSICLSIFIF